MPHNIKGRHEVRKKLKNLGERAYKPIKTQ